MDWLAGIMMLLCCAVAGACGMWLARYFEAKEHRYMPQQSLDNAEAARLERQLRNMLNYSGDGKGQLDIDE